MISRALVATAVAFTLAACTPPESADRRVEAPRRQTGTGPAGSPAGDPFYGATTQALRSLASLIATGVEGITAGQPVEIARGESAEPELEESIGYRDELERAFEERGQRLARRRGEGRVIVTSSIVSIERLKGDRDLVTVSTVVTDRATGQVLTTRLDRTVLRDLLTAPTIYRTSKPPTDLAPR